MWNGWRIGPRLRMHGLPYRWRQRGRDKKGILEGRRFAWSSSGGVLLQRRSVLIFPQDSDCAFANQITDPAPMKVQMELDPDDDERPCSGYEGKQMSGKQSGYRTGLRLAENGRRRDCCDAAVNCSHFL